MGSAILTCLPTQNVLLRSHRCSSVSALSTQVLQDPAFWGIAGWTVCLPALQSWQCHCWDSLLHCSFEAQHIHNPAPTAMWAQRGLELLQVCAVVFGGWLAIKLKEVSNFFLLLSQTNPVLTHSLTSKTCKRLPSILLCAMWMHQANRKEPPHSHLGKSSAETHVVQSGLR